MEEEEKPEWVQEIEKAGGVDAYLAAERARESAHPTNWDAPEWQQAQDEEDREAAEARVAAAAERLVVDESAAPESDGPLAPLKEEFLPYSEPVPLLARPAIASHPAPEIRENGDTETLLNGLIAECHFLMREVALPSAVRVNDADTRVRFLRNAMDIAITGAKIGKSVARLRSAGVVSEIRQRHISERVVTTPAPLLENGLPKRDFNGGGKPGKTSELANGRAEWQSPTAFKNGRHTKAARALRARICGFKSRVRRALAQVEDELAALEPRRPRT